MATTFEFAVIIDQRHYLDNSPLSLDGWSDLQPGDSMTILGKSAPGIDAGVEGPHDTLGTPSLGQLDDWSEDFCIGREFINTPPANAPRGNAMGNLIVMPGDTAPGRGDKVTNITKLDDKIGCERVNGVINVYFQCYTGEF